MILTPLEFMNGLFSLIFISISILIGLRITLNYWKNKERIYVLVGLTWICMATPWCPSAFSFLSILMTGETLPLEFKLFIGIFFAAFAVLFWLTAITDLLYKENQKIIILIFLIIGIIVDGIILYFLFTKPSYIGTEVGHVDEDYTLFVNIYVIGILIIAMITGTLFARASIKLGTPKMKLRGISLLIAFYSFIIGVIFDMFSPISVIYLIIARLILISSAIEFYCGFVLPKWLKRIFLKE